MPVYDFKCRVCHRIFEAFVMFKERLGVCCKTCGAATDVVWMAGGRTPTVIGDSMDQVIENLSAQPKRYLSRSELKRDMAAAGVEHRVKHVGVPGSDKSPHTVKWI
jgi:putative FmdB family regulatory protein